MGQAEGFAHDTNLILVKQLHRLAKLELKIVGKSADIVVRLDTVGLDDVGINGTLCKEFDTVKLSCLFLKDADLSLMITEIILIRQLSTIISREMARLL